MCVTHQMSRKKRHYSVGSTVPYERKNYKWYLMVLGQYMTILAGTWSVKLVLLGITWYRVSKGLVCLYILEKVEIWSGVTDASLTHWLTDSHLKDRATQLLIKYKSGALVPQWWFITQVTATSPSWHLLPFTITVPGVLERLSVKFCVRWCKGIALSDFNSYDCSPFRSKPVLNCPEILRAQADALCNYEQTKNK